ncbi:hypothetical protein FACS1894102_6170 [Spirochaetia bacterium]|nr:hypothetical protein FACS1894102_6170 [Spirochaetia bacterium]
MENKNIEATGVGLSGGIILGMPVAEMKTKILIAVASMVFGFFAPKLLQFLWQKFLSCNSYENKATRDKNKLRTEFQKMTKGKKFASDITDKIAIICKLYKFDLAKNGIYHYEENSQYSYHEDGANLGGDYIYKFDEFVIAVNADKINPSMGNTAYDGKLHFKFNRRNNIFTYILYRFFKAKNHVENSNLVCALKGGL